MTKGRNTPPRIPPWELVKDKIESIEDLPPPQPGLHMICYAHEPWCKAGRTQRMQDCTCDPDVSLLRYRDDGGAT